MKQAQPITTVKKYCPTCGKKTEVYHGVCQECLMDISGVFVKKGGKR